MEKIKNNPLFEGIADYDFDTMLNCLNYRKAAYKKDTTILHAGDKLNFVGLILSGSVKIIKADADGNVFILAKLGVMETFGETFAYADLHHCPVTIQAAEDTEVIFIDCSKIIASCSNACIFHAKLIKNMLKLFAQKNLRLNQKIEIMSKRSTRDKIMCLLDNYCGGEGKFTIPFNREEMANYLCVDRSALSNELCKMRDEGLISFRKNEFEKRRKQK